MAAAHSGCRQQQQEAEESKSCVSAEDSVCEEEDSKRQEEEEAEQEQQEEEEEEQSSSSSEDEQDAPVAAAAHLPGSYVQSTPQLSVLVQAAAAAAEADTCSSDAAAESTLSCVSSPSSACCSPHSLASDRQLPQLQQRDHQQPTQFRISRTASCACELNTEPQQPVIVMDAMVFGMGCCCLQVTMQSRDMSEARYLYDQLAVLSPFFLALTAATPFAAGKLADWDARWNIISQAVDDRTPFERGLESSPASSPSAALLAPQPLSAASAAASSSEQTAQGNAADMDCSSAEPYAPTCASWLPAPGPLGGERVLSKSRYSSVDLFIAQHPRHKPAYDDVDAPVDARALALLSNSSALGVQMDPLLARHVASLWVRDPLVMFAEHLQAACAAGSCSTHLFESIQSTNWRTVRFKPPPPSNGNSNSTTGSSEPGWRVEFRPMEVQVSDFENAAYSVFVLLLSRAILAFDLNFYMPLSLVDMNMERAHARDAVHRRRFFCRQFIRPGQEDNESVLEYSLDEIMNGCGGQRAFPGLVPIVRAYLSLLSGLSAHTRAKLGAYLDLVSRRASGELLTWAAYYRQFIAQHPAYQHDSILRPAVVHDLVSRCDDIAHERIQEPALFGDLRSRASETAPPPPVPVPVPADGAVPVPVPVLLRGAESGVALLPLSDAERSATFPPLSPLTHVSPSVAESSLALCPIESALSLSCSDLSASGNMADANMEDRTCSSGICSPGSDDISLPPPVLASAAV